MSDWIVSPTAPTTWRLDCEGFAALIADRWPEADVVRHTGEHAALVAVSYAHAHDDDGPTTARLLGGRQAIGIDGDLRRCAAEAAWIRGLVPAEQELAFHHTSGDGGVPLEPGCTAERIVGLVEAGS